MRAVTMFSVSSGLHSQRTGVAAAAAATTLRLLSSSLKYGFRMVIFRVFSRLSQKRDPVVLPDDHDQAVGETTGTAL